MNFGVHATVPHQGEHVEGDGAGQDRPRSETQNHWTRLHSCLQRLCCHPEEQAWHQAQVPGSGVVVHNQLTAIKGNIPWPVHYMLVLSTMSWCVCPLAFGLSS